MRIGVAYYPEHWPRELWPEDARRMAQAGVDVVRLGEAAWSRLEPKRGQFDMDWLGEAIEVLAAEGLELILCTPTATPPPWLFHRHPSMVPQDACGRHWHPGSRRHVCLNSRPYRRYVLRVVREMARTFGERPEVIAWQVDSELASYGSAECYCDDCEQAFREWLKRRYGMIDRLNKLWGSVFWSQQFTDWHEVRAPRRTPGGPHPSLLLDYRRFTSATVRDFVAEQRDLIAQYSAGRPKPVTTNVGDGGAGVVNWFSLAGSQDVAGMSGCPAEGGDPDATAMRLDLARSAGGGAFWLSEQQAGADAAGLRPRPGRLRLWSFQAAARGASLVSYLRWRTAPFGHQMRREGMLDAWGSAGRRFDELTQTVAELKGHADRWQSRAPAARVALVLDYQAHWALEADDLGTGLDCLAHVRVLYGLLRRRGIGVRLIAPEADPAGHDLLVLPMPVIGREADARLYGDFAAAGGSVLVTAPAGIRTETNTWPAVAPPGPLTELLGARIVEHAAPRPEEGVEVRFGDARFPVRAFCCELQLRGAEPLGEYGGPWYAGSPAACVHPVGEGSVRFLSAAGGPQLYEHMLDASLSGAGIEAHPWSAERVEVVPLSTPEGEAPLTFVLNHGAEEARLPLQEGAAVTDLLTGEEHEDEVRLEGCGVALIRG